MPLQQNIFKFYPFPCWHLFYILLLRSLLASINCFSYPNQLPHNNFNSQTVNMADRWYGPYGRGGSGGHGGAPPPPGGEYGEGWGYGYGYERYGGGYHAPLGIGNNNTAVGGNNEIRVHHNPVPGSDIGNNNRAGGSNTVIVGDNPTPPEGYSYGIHYFRAGLPY